MNDNEARIKIGRKVKEFYSVLPFRSDSVENLKQSREKYFSSYTLPSILEPIFTNASKVIDVGCGTGEQACGLASIFGFDVVAVDMTDVALEKARAVADLMELQNIRFECHDLFDLPYGPEFDIVNCDGVLHHTGDCKAGLTAISKLVSPGGIVSIGLYHKFGRQPFLDMFSDIRQKIENGENITKYEDEMTFEKFKALMPGDSEEHLRSWFRDQVLHPHESQHTYKEVYEWLVDLGFVNLLAYDYEKNDYVKITGADDGLFIKEKSYIEYGKKAAMEKQYYAGYMMMIGEKPILR